MRSSGLLASPWFLLVALACFVPTRSAPASACHTPERPTLGLASSWDLDRPPVRTELPVSGPAQPQFRPRPCPADQSGPTPRPAPVGDFATLCHAIVPPAPPASFGFDRPDPARPAAIPSPLERPPRLLARPTRIMA